MGTHECSQSASKSSWDSQDFGEVNMVLKMAHFTSPPGHNELRSLLFCGLIDFDLQGQMS